MASSDLVPLVSVTGTAASIVTVLGAVRSYNSRQRRKWTEEGKNAQRNTEALDANTKAAGDNTRAIGELMRKLDDFAHEVRTELNGHRERIGRLEDLTEGSMSVRRRTPGDGGPEPR